jgi:hypothetical protein
MDPGAVQEDPWGDWAWSGGTALVAVGLVVGVTACVMSIICGATAVVVVGVKSAYTLAG